MRTVALKAHFDGEHIVLDEPFDLQAHSGLIVTVLTEPNSSQEDWEAMACENLASAYGPDEPEYTAGDLIRPK